MRGIRLLALIPFAIGAVASAADFRIDPALVDSLSVAPSGLMRADPYLIHFRKGELNLYCVSADHESREDSKTFAVIRSAFAAFPIKRVIVEGRRNYEGDVSAESAREIVREVKGGRYKWSEGDYAITFAYKKRVRAIGGEPRERDVFRALRRAGFTSEDILGLNFVNMIPAYRRQGRLATDGSEVLFGETTEWNRRAFGISEDLAFDYAAFRLWYRAKTGASFDPQKVNNGNYETTRPDPKGTFLQRMAEATSNIRNRFLAGVITRELLRHKHVLVVYGSGHHAAQRRALVAAFGEPVYEGMLTD